VPKLTHWTCIERREVIVTFSHCEKDGVSISEFALVLGGLVISVKENSAWWQIWPRRREVVGS
jgi:hypothetical protein